MPVAVLHTSSCVHYQRFLPSAGQYPLPRPLHRGLDLDGLSQTLSSILIALIPLMRNVVAFAIAPLDL